MMMNNSPFNKNNKERLIEIVESIRKQDGVFIVEGKKDKVALMSIGVGEERILEVSSMPTYLIKEALSPFFTINDFLDEDKEGNKIRKRIEQAGIALNHTLRRRLFNMLRVSHMEEVGNILRKI